MLRKLARSIARNNMERAEIPKINKKRSNGKSFFASHWREWVFKKIKTPKKKQKRRSA